MSRLAQERQGGPLVSHYTISIIKLIERYGSRGEKRYLDLADTAGIAGLAQSGFAGVHGDNDAMRAIPCFRT